MDRRTLLAAYANGRRWFAGVELARQDLSGADLAGICLAGADLRWACLRESSLFRADLRRVSGCRSTFRGAMLGEADLSGADLAMADLVWTDLRDACLCAAHLRGAWLAGATLQAADLRGASLRLADMMGADLRFSDLRGADLSGADLRSARLEGAVHDSTTSFAWAHPLGVKRRSARQWGEQPEWLRPSAPGHSGFPRDAMAPTAPVTSRAARTEAKPHADPRMSKAYVEQCALERALFVEIYDQQPQSDAHEALLAARRELGRRVRKIRAAMSDEQARAIWPESGVCMYCGDPIRPGDPYRLRSGGRMACHACDAGIRWPAIR